MLRIRVGDRVRIKDAAPELGSRTGAIIDISYLSKNPELDDPMGDSRVYVLQLEDGAVLRFKGDEIEPA